MVDRPSANYADITACVGATNKCHSRTEFIGYMAEMMTLLHELSIIHDEIHEFIVSICDIVESRANLI